MRDFEASSREKPEAVTLPNGHRYLAYSAPELGHPEVGSSEHNNRLACSFVAVEEQSGYRRLAYPACRLDGEWHAFGSNFGTVTWARTPVVCLPVKPIS